MHIGIDIQPLQTGTRYAGVGCYLRHVIQSLSRIDVHNEYTLLLNNSDYLEDVAVPAPHWKKYALTRKHRLGTFWWCWDTLYLPAVLLKERIDIYHYNSLSEAEHLAPPISMGKPRLVATIHDLIPLALPSHAAIQKASSCGEFDYFAKLRRLKSADAIFADSACSKRDIVRFMKIPEDRVVVAYNGIEESFFREPPPEALAQFKQRYALPEPMILYVGGYYSPRKNLERLLDAYAILLHDAPAPKPVLVLAGLSNPVHKQQIEALIHAKRLAERILTLPYIPDEELPLLYRTAALLAYPSLYEGFGLPVAEALACGTVVATSNCSSLPEIGGDACLYFDPWDVNAIAEALYIGLTDRERRWEFQRKGPLHVARFSWEACARTVLSVYEQI